jgi:hypothetical protein
MPDGCATFCAQPEFADSARRCPRLAGAWRFVRVPVEAPNYGSVCRPYLVVRADSTAAGSPSSTSGWVCMNVGAMEQQHGALRPAHDGVGNATEHGPRRSGQGLGAPHNQVGTLRLRAGHDRSRDIRLHPCFAQPRKLTLRPSGGRRPGTNSNASPPSWSTDSQRGATAAPPP